MSDKQSFFIIGADGREYGPVDLEMLQRWAREGRIVASTQVRRDGTATWETAATLPELAPYYAATPPVVGEMEDTEMTLAERERSWREDHYEVRIGVWMGRGWQLFWEHCGPIVGAFLLLVCIRFGLRMLPFGAGSVADVFLRAVWIGGFYYFLLRRLRRDSQGSFSDLFAGFSRALPSLILSNLLIVIFVVLANIPLGIGAIFFGAWFTGVTWQDLANIVGFYSTIMANPAGAAANPATMTNSAQAFQARLQEILATMSSHWQNDQWTLLGWLLLLGILVLPGILVSMYYMFTWLLAIDCRFDFWRAMEISRKVVARHWFALTTFAALLLPVINLCGFVCCVCLLPTLLIGDWVTLTTPFVACCSVAAYEDIFRTQRTNPPVNVDKSGAGG